MFRCNYTRTEEDESDSDLDIISNAKATTSKEFADSTCPLFTPSETILGISSNVKNGLSRPLNGLSSDSEDGGPFIFSPDSVGSGRSISTPNGPKPSAAFGAVSPIQATEDDKHSKDHKSMSIKNESRRKLITAYDSNDEDSLFYSKTQNTTVPSSSKVVLNDNAIKRTKPNRKLRKKKGLFDSSSSSSTEETVPSNITSLENEVIPDLTASTLKKPVGGINIFNSAITKAIQSQKQNGSSANEHSNFSSSEASSSTPSSVQKEIVKNLTDQAISSSVLSKSSHTASGIEAEKVSKPVRHNSLFSDEEDLFAPVPMPKSHSSSGNPVSLFDDSDDDLFGAPSKAYNVVPTISNVQSSNSKANFKPQVALSQSNNKNSEPKEANENIQYSVKPKVYEANKCTPPSMKYPKRKTVKNIFGSSSSGDEDIFAPSIQKTENQRKPFLPSTSDAQAIKNSSSGEEDGLFGPSLKPITGKQQLPELRNSNIASTCSVSHNLKDKNSSKNFSPSQSKKNISDALEKDKMKTNVNQDNKNLRPQKTSDNPFSSSSDDDIFNFSNFKQNKGELSFTSKNDKDNDRDVNIAIPKSYKSNDSSPISVQTKSQDLSNSSNLINPSKLDPIFHSHPVSNSSFKPLDNFFNSKSNLEIRKPLTIFDDDSDEDIFAGEFGSRTTYIGTNGKHITDLHFSAEVKHNDALDEISNNEAISSTTEKVCISDAKVKDTASIGATFIHPSHDAFIDADAQKTEHQGGNSFFKPEQDLPIFDGEDGDDIFSSKSTEKLFGKKMSDGNKSHSDVKSPLAISASTVAKEIILSYDEDDIFSSDLSCNVNSFNAISAISYPSNQKAPTSKQITDKSLPADFSTENNDLLTSLSTKEPSVLQTDHYASIDDSKINTEEVTSDSKRTKIPPKVSQKPVIPKIEKTKCQDGSNVIDGTQQLSDTKSDEHKEISVANSNIDNTVKDLFITKSPKKPIGGVALFGGNELLAKIKKRQDKEVISEHESTSPTSEENIFDYPKTIHENMGKYSGTETPIQSVVPRVRSFLNTEGMHSGERPQKIISLERGSSFEDPPSSSSISVLKSMNKDRPRIKQQRNPPSRSKRKANIASKEIDDKNIIEDLPKLACDDKQASVYDVVTDSGACNSTMSDIFGDDDDNDLFSTVQKKEEKITSKEDILDSKQEYNPNERVTTVCQNSQTIVKVTVPIHHNAKQDEMSVSPTIHIENKDSGLKFPDRTLKNEQLFDSKIKNGSFKYSSLNLFGDDDDDDDDGALFSGSSSIRKIKASGIVTSKPNLNTSKKKKISLFSDDEDEDLVFDTKGSIAQQTKETRNETNARHVEKKTSLFSDDESEDLFNSSSIDRKASKKEIKPAFQHNIPVGEASKQKKNDVCNDPLMGGHV